MLRRIVGELSVAVPSTPVTGSVLLLIVDTVPTDPVPSTPEGAPVAPPVAVPVFDDPVPSTPVTP
jgi:hypothetical protein